MPPKAPAFWNVPGSTISPMLAPFSWLYRAGAAIHEAAASPYTAPVPVICVGNVTLGGAGKTPVVLALANMLAARGVKVMALSRGYGGSLPGPVFVHSTLHSAAEVGDEPLLLARTLPTVIAKDRVQGAKFAVAQGAEVILMDDGLQNPRITKTLSLLVVDGAYGFGNGRVFPAGPLRETARAAVARVRAVINIGDMSDAFESYTEKPVLTARLTVPEAVRSRLSGTKVLAFAGIARPEKFRATLEECGAEVSLAAFPDHHPYTQAELEMLDARAKQENRTLVTTEKDAVRLPEAFRAQTLIVPVELIFDAPARMKEMLDHALRG